MASVSKDAVKMIAHYKKSLEAPDVAEERILHCIGVLHKLSVTVTLLQETGIGRTVNGLCKSEVSEQVRAAAKSLVNKWKALVVNESSAEDEPARQSQEEHDEKEHIRRHQSSKHAHRREPDAAKKGHRAHHHHHNHHHHHRSSGSNRDGNESVKQESKAPSLAKLSESQSTGDKNDGGGDKSKSDKHSHRSSASSGKDRKRSKDESEHRHKSSKRHRKESSVSKEDQEIDGSAGTSFADALAMMDGPSSVTPTQGHKSGAKAGPSVANDLVEVAVKTKASTGSSKKSTSEHHSSASGSSNSNSSSHQVLRPSGDKLSTAAGSSRDNSSAPFLLAPSTKLAPLLDPEELKRDILGPTTLSPVVISNTYTPSTYLNPMNLPAVIQKSKRAGGQPVVTTIEPFKISQSRARTKVYSGNKCAQTVVSLHEMCIRVLQKNVDALEYTGGVPYDILEPILFKCTANQLATIEYYNPYLAEDTNSLWETHVQRTFRGKKRQEMESWAEMYQRCQQEEQVRLSHLTESIKQAQQTSTPVKQTKLAYMDRTAPPMGRRRGGGGFGASAPSINASLNARATVSGTRMGFLTAGREVQAKRAPLMQKTLALMKKSVKR